MDGTCALSALERLKQRLGRRGGSNEAALSLRTDTPAGQLQPQPMPPSVPSVQAHFGMPQLQPVAQATMLTMPPNPMGAYGGHGAPPTAVLPIAYLAPAPSSMQQYGGDVGARLPDGPDARSAARWITQRLTGASSAAEIIAVFEVNGANFDVKSLCVIWNQLGEARLSTREREHFFQAHDQALRQVQLQTERIIPGLQPRNLAGMPHGIARLGFRPGHSTMRLIAQEAEPWLHEFDPLQLTNTAWAFAKAGVPADSLFDAIAQEAELWLRELSPLQLTNTAWAFAKAGVPADSLFNAIAQEAESLLREYNPQDLTNTVWAFATAGVPAGSLFDAIAREAAPRLDEFNPHDLAITVWAFAKAGVPADPLFDAIAQVAKPRWREFKLQELTNTAWAFAKAGMPADSLIDAIARQTAPRLCEFQPQNLAITAWAFAIAGVTADSLFDAIARQAAQMLEEFSSQNLANTAWAFAKAGVSADSLFDAIARQAEPHLDDFNAQDLANTAWSFAVSGHLPPAFVRTICARTAKLGLGTFSTKNCSQLHHFFVGVELELRPPAQWLQPRHVRVGCRQSIEISAPLRSSQLHLDVSAVLARLGIAHVNELCVPALGYHIDIAILGEGASVAFGPESGAACGLGASWVAAAGDGSGLHGGPSSVSEPAGLARAHAGAQSAQLVGADAAEARAAVQGVTAKCNGLVIEVNGPSHYDSSRRLRPESLMKLRHLQLDGWAVLGVPWAPQLRPRS